MVECALTETQISYIMGLADGRSVRDLAAEHGVSTSTVGSHLSAVYAELGVPNAAAAVAEAFRRGWVDHRPAARARPEPPLPLPAQLYNKYATQWFESGCNDHIAEQGMQLAMSMIRHDAASENPSHNPTAPAATLATTMTRDLTRRAVDVLQTLRTISEVSAHNYEAASSSHTADQALPINFTKAGDLAPSEPSLFEYHRDQINTATDIDQLELAILTAEEALRASRRQAEKRDRDLAPRDMRKIVVDLAGAGLTPAEISWKEDVPLRWVKIVLRSATPRDAA